MHPDKQNINNIFFQYFFYLSDLLKTVVYSLNIVFYQYNSFVNSFVTAIIKNNFIFFIIVFFLSNYRSIYDSFSFYLYAFFAFSGEV